MRTHYEILGLEREATPAEVKSAYRKLSRTAHPDVGGNAALFGMISDAYTVLSDPGKRAEYDRSLSGGRSSSSGTSSSSSSSSHQRRPGPSERRYEQDGPDDFRRGTEEYTRYRNMYADRAAKAAREKEETESAVGSVSVMERVYVGFGTAAWVFFSDVLRTVLPFVGVTVGEPEWPDSYSEASRTALIFFVIGALFVIIPWATRADWRPFPLWEKALLFAGSSLAVVIGWEGVLTFLALLVPYLLLVRRRSPQSASESTSENASA